MPSCAPLISVIMPAYNCEKYVRQAIDSILGQSYRNIELLVADDGSTDKTKEVIDAYTDERIIRLHNKKNSGNLKTWNKLISHAKGEYITFQDADDWSDQNRISSLLEEFSTNKEVSLISSDAYKVDEHGNMLEYLSFPHDHENLIKGLPHEFRFVCAGIMIKRRVFEEYGGFNEFFDRAGAADCYWAGSILLKNKMATINKPLYFYRRNPESFTQVDELRTFCSMKTVSYLIDQRMRTGTDSLEQKRFKELYIYRERLKVTYFLWHNCYKKALRTALKLISRHPFQPASFYKALYIYGRKALRLNLAFINKK